MKKNFFCLLLTLCFALLFAFSAWAIEFGGPKFKSKKLMARYFAEQYEPIVFYATISLAHLCEDPCEDTRGRSELYRTICKMQTEKRIPPNGTFEGVVYLGYFVVTPQPDGAVPHLRWYPAAEFEAKEFLDPENVGRPSDYFRLPAYLGGYVDALKKQRKSASEIHLLWWELFVFKVFNFTRTFATRPDVPPEPAYRPRYTAAPPQHVLSLKS